MTPRSLIVSDTKSSYRAGEGFIKVHRKILESAIWGRQADAMLALTVLLMANWKPGEFLDRGGNLVKVPRGSLVTTERHLAERAKMGRKAMRTSLKRLRNSGFLDHTLVNGYTKLTVRKYSTFQDRGTGVEPESNRSRTGVGPDIRREEDKNRRKQHTSVSKAPPKEVEVAFSTWWKEYPRKEGRQHALRAWTAANNAGVLPPTAALVAAIQSQASRWEIEGRETRYIPQGSTWLNGRRWEDATPAEPHGNGEPPLCPDCQMHPTGTLCLKRPKRT